MVYCSFLCGISEFKNSIRLREIQHAQEQNIFSFLSDNTYKYNGFQQRNYEQ